MSYIQDIKDWAEENYDESFGASCLIESFDDDELAEQFSSLQEAKDWAALKDEQFDNASEGQPTEYEEWQDYMGGDDWDHGQYDEY